ncbi:hypothetical protein T265_10297 [Opisthorchis viverrini]|uniref:GPI inositol-deacylase n=1 Tax=Opisthorchis viverrini TaxID=6198 RepID=A0A074Z2S4_OPIVI|nr:hypothetical protein T265_10297 [Opisthorchis viverrini]KER21366.1 hypothetical protein T265_10297 [Opisthorchis viverrini]
MALRPMLKVSQIEGGALILEEQSVDVAGDDGLGTYKLYKYCSGRYGFPILFLPGTRGSHKTIRSLASSQDYFMHGADQLPFDYFTIDHNEDVTALSGDAVERQSRFIKIVIDVILSMYRGTVEPPQSVLLVGHSLGVISVLNLLSNPEFDQRKITTSSPPVLEWILCTIKSDAIFSPLPRIPRRHPLWFCCLSLAGHVPDVLGRIDFRFTELNVLSLSTSAVSYVWAPCDHLCILWCRQLVYALTSALLDMKLTSPAVDLLRAPTRLRLLQQRLITRPVQLEKHVIRYLPTKSPMPHLDDFPRMKWLYKTGRNHLYYQGGLPPEGAYVKLGPFFHDPSQRVLIMARHMQSPSTFLCRSSTDAAVDETPCKHMYAVASDSSYVTRMPAFSSRYPYTTALLSLPEVQLPDGQLDDPITYGYPTLEVYVVLTFPSYFPQDPRRNLLALSRGMSHGATTSTVHSSGSGDASKMVQNDKPSSLTSKETWYQQYSFFIHIVAALLHLMSFHLLNFPTSDWIRMQKYGHLGLRYNDFFAYPSKISSLDWVLAHCPLLLLTIPLSILVPWFLTLFLAAQCRSGHWFARIHVRFFNGGNLIQHRRQHQLSYFLLTTTLLFGGLVSEAVGILLLAIFLRFRIHLKVVHSIIQNSSSLGKSRPTTEKYNGSSLSHYLAFPYLFFTTLIMLSLLLPENWVSVFFRLQHYMRTGPFAFHLLLRVPSIPSDVYLLFIFVALTCLTWLTELRTPDDDSSDIQAVTNQKSYVFRSIVILLCLTGCFIYVFLLLHTAIFYFRIMLFCSSGEKGWYCSVSHHSRFEQSSSCPGAIIHVHPHQRRGKQWTPVSLLLELIGCAYPMAVPGFERRTPDMLGEHVTTIPPAHVEQYTSHKTPTCINKKLSSGFQACVALPDWEVLTSGPINRHNQDSY